MRMKFRNIVIVFCVISIIFSNGLCINSYAATEPFYTYTYEGNNSLGVAVTIKSDEFISGKIKVKYYMRGKRIKTRIKKFSYVKNNIIIIDSPNNINYGLTGTEKYTVKVYDVHKQKKKDASDKIKIKIKRIKGDGIDDIVMTLTNKSNKTIKYNGTLLMRYAGKDAFGIDCRGEFYDSFAKKGTLGPKKSVKIYGVTWSDYKVKSFGYVDAYYK